MRFLSIIILLLFSSAITAQVTYRIPADTVKIYKRDSTNAELVLENGTRNVKGFLFNTGNGRTVFKQGLVKLNDTTYIIGADTLFLSSVNGIVTSVHGRTGAVTALETDYDSFYPKLSSAYDDPSWITSLAWSKITSAPAFVTQADLDDTAAAIRADFPTGGTTALNNVGTGYDVAVQGTDNVKRLQAGWGIGLDSATSNVVKIAADTSKLATNTSVRDTAAALRYIISGESVAWGTSAQRLALTMMITGQRYYQTDERIGQWIYGNGFWEFQEPARTEARYRGQGAFNVTSAASGGAATIDQTTADSIYLHQYTLTVTNAGNRAAIHMPSLEYFHGLPIDTNYALVNFYRLKINTRPTASEDYLLRFGTGTLSMTSGATEAAYGRYFRVKNDTVWAKAWSNGAGGDSAFVCLANDVDSAFHEFTIVSTVRESKYFIDGVLRATVRPTSILYGAGGALVVVNVKTAGTTGRNILITDALAYITRRRYP